MTIPRPTDPAPAPPVSAVGAPPVAPDQPRVAPTRTSHLWGATVAVTVVLLLLLIFILQNTASVRIHAFGAHPRLPLAIALLLSAVAGALIVAFAGVARVVQLRRAERRARRR